MKTGILIQARMGSQRLPGKVLMPFYDGKSILEIIIRRLKDNFPEIPLVVCTSDLPQDDAISELAQRLNADCFRGNATNVLNRFSSAATEFGFEKIVRVCADNPFLDAGFMRELLSFSGAHPNQDYWSFASPEGTPAIKTHLGLFVEITTADALHRVEASTSDPLYLEHVTNFIYSDPGFDCRFLEFPKMLQRSDLRFTIDDASDFENLRPAYEFYVANGCNIERLTGFVVSNPEILKTMVANIQKNSK